MGMTVCPSWRGHGEMDGLGPTILHGLRWLGSPELWLRRWPLQGHTATQDRAPHIRYKPMSLPAVWGR